MADPDVARVATLLATHAVLLLGAGLLAVVLALATAVAAVRTAGRYRTAIGRLVSAIVSRAREVPMLRRLLDRSQVLVPSGYVAIHLAIGLVLVAAIAGFVSVARETLGDGGELAVFDVTFAHALHAQTSPAWLHVFAGVSWLGSRVVLSVVTLVVAAGLAVRGRTVLAIGWMGAQAGGALLNLGLKTTFARTRPEFADPVLAASSWSFPSGHAMGTFIACGVGCYLLLRERRSWPVTVAAVTLAASWSLIMAFSRLYLGVHFASDVLAGLVAGAAWVAVSVSALEVVHRRTSRRSSVAARDDLPPG